MASVYEKNSQMEAQNSRFWLKNALKVILGYGLGTYQ